MPIHTEAAGVQGTPGRAAFVENVSIPFLVGAQNRDGGWGYHPDEPSSVEPTCWAILALTRAAEPEISADALKRGHTWL